MNANSSPHLLLITLLAAAVFATPTTRLSAQETQPGFFRLINATGIDGTVEFDLNGEKLSEEGYVSGESTGSIGFLPASYRLTARHSKWADVTHTFDLKSGDRLAIIVFSVPVLDQDGSEKKRVIQFATLVCKPRAGSRTAALLSVSRRPALSMSLGETPVVLKPASQHDAILQPKKGFVGIAIAGAAVANLNTEDAGDYGVVVYDQAGGAQRCITFCEIAQ